MNEPSATPRYRNDIKGNVARVKLDCTDEMRSEIQHSEDFILTPEDTDAWHDYADTLTITEIRACFKAAIRSF